MATFTYSPMSLWQVSTVQRKAPRFSVKAKLMKLMGLKQGQMCHFDIHSLEYQMLVGQFEGPIISGAEVTIPKEFREFMQSPEKFKITVTPLLKIPSVPQWGQGPLL